jgi:hypothetical protein
MLCAQTAQTKLVEKPKSTKMSQDVIIIYTQTVSDGKQAEALCIIPF